jgi:hypothetical protein
MYVVAVVVVDDKDICVAGGGRGEKTAGGVCMNEACDRLTIGVDMMGSKWGWFIVKFLGRAEVFVEVVSELLWAGGLVGRLGRSEVLPLLVHMASVHGHREREMFAYLGGRESREGGESVGINGGTPSGDGGAEEGCMIKGNFVGQR